MAQQQQQQQQPPQVDPQLPGPTVEELRDYKLGMERAMAQFREQVQMTGRQAYIDLIHTLKLTSLKLITDLVDAEEDKVLQSICRTDGHHFKTGFSIHARASTSRSYDPEFSTEKFDDTTNEKHGRRCGQNTQPRRNCGQLKKENEKENLQQHRPKKKQNVPKETTEMRTKTTSLLKNQVVRTHHMSRPKRSSREPTRKATSKLYFVRNVFFPYRSN